MLAVASISAAYGRLIENVTQLEGACESLHALGVELSRHCLPSLSGNLYSDGRSSFTFSAQADDQSVSMITFSGRGSAQIQQEHGFVVQPIDSMIVTLAGSATAQKAVGFCRFGDAWKPGNVVTCVAETADGRYDGSFAQNGVRPSVSKLGK